ncbi:InlB B-repeat-containing protein [bacterium]|nr:InlB B-repeat-containing protein [bacterium]
MKQNHFNSRLSQACRPIATALAIAVLTGLSGHAPAQTTSLVLANPHWNIMLTDFGYSDFLLDNTPGFEGREYLSGEWGAAVGYTTGGTTVAPKWLDPQWSYPDWATNSTFHVVSPIVLTGALNADNLPIAESVIANTELQMTLRYEMLDTVTGTPMGATPASAPGTSVSLLSSRYVLKQTYTIKNISPSTVSNIQFFQLLHGLQSQRGLYDNRTYTGPLSAFRYDVTQAGVDAWAVGPGSSSAGLEDFIGFHANTPPSGYELGYYGIEGNGIDNHGVGKPTDGVHLSIENNWQTEPYLSRLGTDVFTPPQRWIAGTERWDLGSLAAGASTSHEVLLSVRTGTKVTAGTGSSGGCNGGSSVPGGLDYQFGTVDSEGSCFAEFSKADNTELAVRIAAGEFDSLAFPTPGSPAQLWNVVFSGTYSGAIDLKLCYDGTLLPAGFDESTLAIYHFSGGAWQTLPGTVDSSTNTIAFSTNTLGPFALGVDGGVMFQINVSESPTNSGIVTGGGAYAQASGVTVVAVANAGYAFVNWTEGATSVSISPSYTFSAQAARTLVANFVAVGSAKTISTVSSPSTGGSTAGDGAYAIGSSATVVATANPGYKFSRWQVNGTTASSLKSYTFTVATDRQLVAKFKPVYTVTATAEPAGDFEVEADSVSYDAGEKVVMKVNHTANGYSFVNWTENGLVVNAIPSFSFNCTGNRNLIANFALGHRIDLSSAPKTAGFASGAGVYENGVTVPLLAEPKPGYIFTHWTEGGTVVSTDPAYDFTSSVNRTLVANFIALPGISIESSAPGTITFSWPDAAFDAGWLLEESPDLLPGNWVVSLRPFSIVGTQRQITLNGPTGRCFFRLKHP